MRENRASGGLGHEVNYDPARQGHQCIEGFDELQPPLGPQKCQKYPFLEVFMAKLKSPQLLLHKNWICCAQASLKEGIILHFFWKILRAAQFWLFSQKFSDFMATSKLKKARFSGALMKYKVVANQKGVQMVAC